MPVYLDLVLILNFLVDFLLLVGANRLAGYPPDIRRAVPAAVLGGLYGVVCLLPGFRFLGNLAWRLVFLGLMAVVAYGLDGSAVRRGILFVFLSMALGGAAGLMGSGSFGGLSAAALGVCALCLLGFQDKTLGNSYVPVEVEYGGKRIRMTALRDTGNTLRDPVTGQSVLVAGAEAAEQLLGLGAEDLGRPVETLAEGRIPGLRLVPYRAVGTAGGMLLAIRCPYIKIGGRTSSGLVAFTAAGLGKGSEYQALTGGV